MASSSQHRCVFVGNIPYDATEEQLIQICEEVGPVVSFRLVTDRETGKPKGYGFCEYKDEETALSARRNLQGYEINGRPLRVDFAENDKNNDRNRDQGRGGPGLAANVDPQKQIGVSAVLGDPSFLQPVGLPVAMAAANLMAGVLGSAQAANSSSFGGLQSQSISGTDPLTLHLAKMTKNQLVDILSEVKAMATQNKEEARQLFLAYPVLLKAVYEAHLMLEQVIPQMLSTSNIQPVPAPTSQLPLVDGQLFQQPTLQALPGMPPVLQNKMHFNFTPHSQSQPNSLTASQYAAAPQLPMQPQVPHQIPQQGTLPGMVTAPVLPSSNTAQQPKLSTRPDIQASNPTSMMNNVQNSLLQHRGQFISTNTGHQAPLVGPNVIPQPSLSTLSRPENGFQPAVPNITSRDLDKPKLSNPETLIHQAGAYTSLSSGNGKASLVNGSIDQANRPRKLLKLEDGKSASFLTNVNTASSAAGSSQAASICRNQVKVEGVSDSQKQNLELTPEMESELLQQVLKLTPEQLNLLPQDQRQQVIQLQQSLRQST